LNACLGYVVVSAVVWVRQRLPAMWVLGGESCLGSSLRHTSSHHLSHGSHCSAHHSIAARLFHNTPRSPYYTVHSIPQVFCHMYNDQPLPRFSFDIVPPLHPEGMQRFWQVNWFCVQSLPKDSVIGFKYEMRIPPLPLLPPGRPLPTLTRPSHWGCMSLHNTLTMTSP